MYVFKIFYFFSAFICVSNAARILGIFHLHSYSHYQLGEMLLKELASRGHEVTMITPVEEKEKIKNFRIITLTNTFEHLKEMKFDMFNFAERSAFSSVFKMNEMMLPFIENTLNHTNVQNLIKSNDKFDLVIIERLLNDAFHGFCAHFEAHCVISSSVPPSYTSNMQMGNFVPPSYMPDLHASLSSKMNFFERAYNGLVYFIGIILFHTHVIPTHNDIMHKYFPTVSHHLTDIFYNVSLTLFNSHVGVNTVIPLSPNMIDIGGYHIKPTAALPKDLKEYLDNAKEGVIFFSMGSNLRSRDLTDTRREAILKAFAELSEKVLWKWEDESLPNQSSNVRISKWVPQNDVLAHPNVKLFVTHGGLLSTLEAIYHGVPIVGIPVYGDQHSNMKIAEEYNYGIGIALADLTAEGLLKCINTVLQNPEYLENARRRSKVLQDNPIPPLEKAIFWIEYVLRHNGAHHLKTASLNLRWYQFLLLDVVAFLTFLVIAPMFICYKICKKLTLKRKAVKKIKKS
ncbi:hypothetical protein RI129_000623 [Pyrocoelia pectoralis]|uniref:UDP-glucuronosyltransferase n=1 Tax=Pyrocoelia pectoralis TaxID=417401 RepID=A0AAN7VUN7_9COLE